MLTHTSVFMDKELKPLFSKFQDKLHEGIIPAAEYLQELSGQEQDAEKIMDGIERRYNVEQDSAAFFMQECGNAMAKKYHNDISVEEKKAIIDTVRNTDIPSFMKKSMCQTLAVDAVNTHDIHLLVSAAEHSDGLSMADYEKLKPYVEEEFGEKEAFKMQMQIMARESPEEGYEMLCQMTENNEISTAEYTETMAYMANKIPWQYQEYNGISLTTKENNDGYSIIVKADAEIEIPDGMDEISIGKKEGGGLSINNMTALKLIQEYHIIGDNALDCIAESNIPPTNPNFVSEMTQKFANFVSAHEIPYHEAKNEAIKVSSVLPDDQKATFESMVNDMLKEHNNTIQEDIAIEDYDHDGNPDIDDEEYEV